MRAVVISQFGGSEVLRLEEVATPQPGPQEILVRVMASALNRADLLQREGRYPAPPGASANIPGMEFAGEVCSQPFAEPTSAKDDSGKAEQRSSRYGAPTSYPFAELTSAKSDSGKAEQRSSRYGVPTSASRKWRAGQRVFGLVPAGAHAEFLTAHEDAVAEIPANLNGSQACAIPEAFSTAHDASW